MTSWSEEKSTATSDASDKLEKPRSSKVLSYIIVALALLMVVYQLISTQYLLQAPIATQNTHLAFALLLVFLSTLNRKPKLWPLISILVILSLIATGYIFIFYSALEARAGLPTTTDIIIGLIIVAVVLEAGRQAFGIILPILGLIFIAYCFLGQYLPYPLWHFPIKLSSVVTSFNMGFTGMFGRILNVSVAYIFLFIILGSLLQITGATRFFLEVGKMAARKLAGGPAMTAMVSSALVGTVTGAGTANVGITGPFTIPLMKKVGYSPEQAGAIEAVASSGGAIMPPIMGAVAFVLASFIDVPYIKVCAMAIIPALFYYLCLTLFVQFNAMKLNISAPPETIDMRTIWVTGPCL